MHSTKNYAIVFLALTTAVGAALAWSQYRELVALRASAMNAEADWQNRLRDATRQQDDLQSKVAALQKKAEEDGRESAAGDAPPDPTNFGRGGGRRGFRELMERPEMQKLMAVEQKGRLDSRYAALFKSLSLTPDQLDKFKNLLVEKQTSMMDVLSAAREQGINPRSDPEAFQKLVADAQTEIDANIRSVLGDDGFAQYQNYEQTLPQRNVVDQLQQRLSYTSTPLTDSQAAQMTQILAANAPQRSGQTANGFAGVFGGGGGGGGTRINETDVNQSLGVLAAPQVDALKQLQQEQQAQADLRAALRQQFQNQGSGGGTSPAPPAPGGG